MKADNRRLMSLKSSSLAENKELEEQAAALQLKCRAAENNLEVSYQMLDALRQEIMVGASFWQTKTCTLANDSF